MSATPKTPFPRVKEPCPCITWARTWTETQGGRFPISNHHPRCAEFKPEPYSLLSWEDGSCIVEPAQAKAILAEAEGSGERYNVSTVMLTRDQFDKLPEFEG